MQMCVKKAVHSSQTKRQTEKTSASLIYHTIGRWKNASDADAVLKAVVSSHRQVHKMFNFEVLVFFCFLWMHTHCWKNWECEQIPWPGQSLCSAVDSFANASCLLLFDQPQCHQGKFQEKVPKILPATFANLRHQTLWYLIGSSCWTKESCFGSNVRWTRTGMTFWSLFGFWLTIDPHFHQRKLFWLIYCLMLAVLRQPSSNYRHQLHL